MRIDSSPNRRSEPARATRRIRTVRPLRNSARVPADYPPPPRNEPYWPAPLTVALAICLQLLLPGKVRAGPDWLVPSVEGALLVGITVATPGDPLRIPHRGVLWLTGVVAAANGASLVLLIYGLLHHQFTSDAYGLTFAGALIWVTNVLAFGLLYWELDRGGRDARASGQDHMPDFLFAQMTGDAQPLVGRSWRPTYIDYQYLSLTNSAAFSPTDTMPLTQRAKVIMGFQSVIALLTIGIVVARAVNALR
jgi:hypothetical protein